MENYITKLPFYYLQNRPRLYKGISIDTKKWVIGAFMYFPKNYPYNCYEVPPETNDDFVPLIIDTTINQYGKPNFTRSNAVYSNTISEFTGLYDKNGQPVWEGDIVKYPSGKYHSGDIGVVEYVIDSFKAHIINNADIAYQSLTFQSNYSYEIIGNIWDNPEIIEKYIINT